jgi:hypothetical protein
MNMEKIIFRQARDFGETFNVTFKFLRQNFKHFFKSLLFIAGPFVFITAIAGAFYQSDSIATLSDKRMFGNSDPFAQYGWAFLFFILASLVSTLALIGTTFCYMSIYETRGPGNFTVSDVASSLVKNAGKLIVGFLLLIALIIGLALAVGLVIGLLASITPVLGVVVGFLLVIALLILAPPYIWQLSTFYLVAIHEDISPSAALSRVRNVMKGEFWWTWLLVVASTLGLGVVSLIFTLPQIIYQMVLMFSNIRGGENEFSVSFVVVATICTFCSTLLYSILYLMNGFHYFSLAEKKDGTGLMDRINEIGNTPVNNVDQQY